MIMKIKLKFNVIKILMKELNQSEMWAIYLMGLGQEIPDKVTKFDLIKIIYLLCKKLDWIDEEPMEETNEGTDDKQVTEESKANETNPVIVNNRPQTDGNHYPSKSVKIEEVHQTYSVASDSQQTDDIPRQEEEEKNVCSTAEEILGTEINMMTTVEEISRTDKERVGLDEEGSAEENITDPQNDRDELPFSCNLCHQRFSKERYLAAHAYMKHEDTDLENEVPLNCSKCDKKFTIRDELNIHEMAHSENKQYSCSKCDEKFSRDDMLRSHEILHATDHLGLSTDDSIFIDNLIRKLNNNDRYNRSAQESFNCTQCNKTFSTSQSLRIHVRIHTQQKLFHCSKCDYNATNLQYLKIHQRIHTGEKPFSCSYCDYKSTMSGNLKTHEKMHHTGENPFKCFDCDYRCTSAVNLRLHMEKHPGRSLLKPKRRTRSHSGVQLGKFSIISGNKTVKSFRCSQCDEIFTQNSELWKHKKQTHKEDIQANQLFNCEICGQSFSFANSCKRHMRTHTKEKPYSCYTCEKKFRFTEELRRHSKICKIAEMKNKLSKQI